VQQRFVVDPFAGSGGVSIGSSAMLNDLIKLVEAVGALEPRVVALMVIALGLVVVAYIVTR
jgi:hypothetical protein